MGPPPALLERYLQYKRLLAANSAILTIVADLQVKVSEGFLFDMHYVRQACERLGQEVETLVAALTGHVRRPLLRPGQRPGAGWRNWWPKILAVGIKLTPVPLTLPLEEVREGLFYGGKAEKLGELTRLGLKVPAGFGVSAYAQKLFFEIAGLEAFIRQAISHSHIRDLESLREAGEAIRERIMAQELPRGLWPGRSPTGWPHLTSDRVAVRSSALQEDSQFSFAGQFETILNVPRDRVLERYKEVIASQFTPRSLYYCHTSGFSYQELAMGVVVMEMVPAETAGVLYTDDPRGGDATIINAVCGLGSLAVGGVVEPGHLPGGGGPAGGQSRGRKDPDARAGPRGRHPGPGHPGGAPGAVPGGGTGPGPDRPWAGLSKSISAAPRTSSGPWGRTAGFTCSRPGPCGSAASCAADYLPPKIKGAEVLLENGIVASRGAAAGRVYHLKDEALKEIPRGVVLVTSQALPEYAVAVGRAVAVVSEAGSATSHLATVLREARVPAVFGAKGALGLLHAGRGGHRGRLLRQRLRRQGGGTPQGAPGRRRSGAPEPGLQGAGAGPEAHHPPEPPGPPGRELPARGLPHLPRHHPLCPREGHGGALPDVLRPAGGGRQPGGW